MAKFAKELKYQVIVDWPRPPRYATTDPNEAWREWLETNVGRQDVDWSWDVLIRGQNQPDAVVVNFNDDQLATMFKLTAS